MPKSGKHEAEYYEDLWKTIRTGNVYQIYDTEAGRPIDVPVLHIAAAQEQAGPGVSQVRPLRRKGGSKIIVERTIAPTSGAASRTECGSVIVFRRMPSGNIKGLSQ